MTRPVMDKPGLLWKIRHALDLRRNYRPAGSATKEFFERTRDDRMTAVAVPPEELRTSLRRCVLKTYATRGNIDFVLQCIETLDGIATGATFIHEGSLTGRNTFSLQMGMKEDGTDIERDVETIKAILLHTVETISTEPDVSARREKVDAHERMLRAIHPLIPEGPTSICSSTPWGPGNWSQWSNALMSRITEPIPPPWCDLIPMGISVEVYDADDKERNRIAISAIECGVSGTWKGGPKDEQVVIEAMAQGDAVEELRLHGMLAEHLAKRMARE
jgi:hypothetical protein